MQKHAQITQTHTLRERERDKERDSIWMHGQTLAIKTKPGPSFQL
jgi:hypothetical protein